MNCNTRKLRQLSQQLWLDHITCQMLNSGTLARYIAELSVTGLSSNAKVFEQEIANGSAYDDMIRRLGAQGLFGEDLFFELALQDLTAAADLFRPIHRDSGGSDGWVAVDTSPLQANDTYGTVRAAVTLHARAARPNLFIKIAGTTQGLPAIEQSIFLGIPVNVTLLFSHEQYVAVSKAYMRGLERRLAAGLDARVESVASLSIAPWDHVLNEHCAPALRNRIGIAVAARSYKAYRDLLDTERWQKLANAGARPQRLLWASVGAADGSLPAADLRSIAALAAADTINTVPLASLLAFAEHGEVGAAMAGDGGDAETVFDELRRMAIDPVGIAERLQRDGLVECARTWTSLLAQVRRKNVRAPQAQSI